MESRFTEQNADMLHFVRLCAGTKVKRNTDGKVMPCDDNDPDAIAFVPHTQTFTVQAPEPEKR